MDVSLLCSEMFSSSVYRIMKRRHLKITTTIDKVTVDAYHDVKSHSFLDNTPTAVNNTVVDDSRNVSPDNDEEVLAFQRSDLKSFLLLLVFGVCACIYGSTLRYTYCVGIVLIIPRFYFDLTVTLAVLSKPAMNEIFLVLVSYVIIGTFFIIEICIFYSSSSR